MLPEVCAHQAFLMLAIVLEYLIFQLVAGEVCPGRVASRMAGTRDTVRQKPIACKASRSATGS